MSPVFPVHNNPLVYTDPSGYFSVRQGVGIIVQAALFSVALTLPPASGFALAAFAGFSGTYIATGSVNAAFTSAAISAATYGVMYSAGWTSPGVSESSGAAATATSEAVANTTMQTTSAKTLATPESLGAINGSVGSTVAKGSSLTLDKMRVTVDWATVTNDYSAALVAYNHVLSLRWDPDTNGASRQRAQDRLAQILGAESGQPAWAAADMLRRADQVATYAEIMESVGGFLAGAPIGASLGATMGVSGSSSRFLVNCAGKCIDLNTFRGLSKNDAIIQAGRSGPNRPLYGPPNSYTHSTGGHAYVFGPDGRIMYDVSAARIKPAYWSPDGAAVTFPPKGKFVDPPQDVLRMLDL